MWDLLGRVRDVEVRPGFARDVARQARLSTADHPGALRSALGRVWEAFTSAPPAALGLAATAAVAVALVVLNPGSQSDPAPRPGTSGIAATDTPAPANHPQAAPVIGVATFTAEEIDSLTADVNVPAGTVDAMAELEELNSLLAISDVTMLDDAELAALLF